MSHDVYVSDMTRTRVQSKISGFAGLHHSQGTTDEQLIENMKDEILHFLSFRDVNPKISDVTLANIAGAAQALLERRLREREVNAA